MEIKKNIKFDFLLPIGGACQTRHQIERYLKKTYEIKQPACFFDWLGLGGVRGVKKMIEQDFLLKPSDFVVKSVYIENHFTPIHEPTGFRFQHDFGTTKESRQNKDIAMKTMADNMEISLSKYKHLSDRTRRILSSGKTIGLAYHGTTSIEKINELMGLLKNKFNSEFYFINIIEPVKTKKIYGNNIISIEIDNSSVKGTAGEWMGDNTSWDTALNELQINESNYKELV